MGVEQLQLEGLSSPPPAPVAQTERAFTPEQQEAVDRRGEPLLLSAAAGSGKTAVLVERFVRAVAHDGILPARILAITFTERAAGELRSRVRSALLELGEREAARDTEAAFVSTFHGFCARLLRTHPLVAGLDPDFRILEEGRAGTLRELAFEAACAEFLEGEDPAAVDLVAAYGIDDVAATIERVYAELRSRGQLRPQLPGAPVGADDELEREAAATLAMYDRLLGLYASHYERLKRERAAVDFDDLELLAGALLAGRPGIRAAWSERFELLMVDEFQDTNPRQLAILDALARGNLFTVGDEFQSIYGFRHADVRLFRERRERLARDGASLALKRNFRSRPNLLELVNHVYGARFEGFPALQAGREPDPQAPAGAPIELLLTGIHGWDELAAEVGAGLPWARPWRQAEARMLAQRVAELVEAGEVRAREVVVLLRATADIDVFERALAQHGLTTLATVGTFWSQQQIVDVHMYLRALANPRDEEALYSTLASPLVGCSRDALALLARAARDAGSAWEAALAAGGAEALAQRDRERLVRFCAWLAREREEGATRGPSELIERVVEHAGCREHVLCLPWGERRLANIHKLLRLARAFEADEGRDLRAFVDHVERLRAAVAREPEAPVAGLDPDAVRLMTMHAAKGLEFPVVCVADLGRRPNTSTPVLLVDGERVGLRLRRLGEGEAVDTLAFAELKEERRRREADEEARVLYVAMTRARDRLLLSGAVPLEKWPEPNGVSPQITWLGPAISKEVCELAAASDRSACELRVGAGGSISVRCVFNRPAGYGEVLRAPARVDRGEGVGGGEDEVRATGAARPPERELGAARPRSARHPAPAPSERPTMLSYTTLAEQQRCGYRYYLERVLGMPEERAHGVAARSGSLTARERGTLVHRLLESVDFARPLPPDCNRVGAEAAALGMAPSRREREEVATLIARACESPFAARLGAAGNARREHPFAFAPRTAAADPVVRGVLDLLCEERDGTFLVVDYKSDQLDATRDPETILERDYAMQRLVYALAVLREGALEAEVVHWFLADPARPVSARYTAADRAALEDQLERTVARAWADPYAVTAHPHRALCETCPGRAALCSWDESHTLREDIATDITRLDRA
ncbi:MAG TPA: UvrD-helicase domain-containing protein [Solirubrobacteraceae bacterium]|nr:UvrD-helicase domain-containing protein [Solirubrobacteraceae bacterium]